MEQQPQPFGGEPQQFGGNQNGDQTYTEPGKDNEQPVQNLEEPQQEQPMQQQQPMGADQKSELERPFEQFKQQESLKKKLYECNILHHKLVVNLNHTKFLMILPYLHH